jgi:hypothetical protein
MIRGIVAIALTVAGVSAQDAADSGEPTAPIVAMPDGIRALIEPELTRFVGMSSRATFDAWVEGTSVRVGGIGLDIDRVLLFGGAAARWAHREKDGTWTWDTTGFVVAGLAPAKLHAAYIDILRPLDGQVPQLELRYPTFETYQITDGRFVVGVPAAGRWEVILDASTGSSRALAVCEAIPETALDRAKLPEVDARDVDFRVLANVPAELEPTQAIQVQWQDDHFSSMDQWVGPAAGPLTLRLQPSALVARGWCWAPGWECLEFDGKDLSLDHQSLVRDVRPGRSLRVRVLDEAGNPVTDASVSIFGKDRRSVLAAWEQGGNQQKARLFGSTEVGPTGETTAFGLPGGIGACEVCICRSGHSNVFVFWDGFADTVEVVIDG